MSINDPVKESALALALLVNDNEGTLQGIVGTLHGNTYRHQTLTRIIEAGRDVSRAEAIAYLDSMPKKVEVAGPSKRVTPKSKKPKTKVAKKKPKKPKKPKVTRQ